ncbi:MAG: PQQ-binding-like beta-propeller repeat protein [Pirellulaceae bacterium]|nr:PQQ-binding-like beta-propeller repeat protein [Pirellulaceae bacterium]
MNRSLNLSLLVAGFMAIAIPRLSQAEWLQFRGPSGAGVLANSTYPTTWSVDDNIAWNSPLPGGGWSSPIVVGDRVFITMAVSKDIGRPKGFGGGVASMRGLSSRKPPQDPISFELHCLSLIDGSEIWKRVVDDRRPAFAIHPSNTYATESPAVSQDQVFVYFASTGVVACYDLAGEEIWKREIGAFRTSNNFGTASSVAVDDGKVFIQCDNEDQSFVVAFDAASGEEAWRKERDVSTSWSSPIVWKNRLRNELILCGSDSVISYEPNTGKQLWSLTGTGGTFSGSPTCDADRIYFGNSGRNSRGPLVAIAAGAEGELDVEDETSDKGIVWVQPSSGPGMASPVVVDGKLFVLSRSILTCHDAKTGERLYRNRLPAKSVAASLWSTNNQLFVLDEAGNTFVVEVAEDFELVGENSISGLFWSTPAVSTDCLLLRAADRLYCIRSTESP